MEVEGATIFEPVRFLRLEVGMVGGSSFFLFAHVPSNSTNARVLPQASRITIIFSDVYTVDVASFYVICSILGSQR